MTGRWLDPSKIAMLITYCVTACRAQWMSREGWPARLSDNPRSVIKRRCNLSRFKKFCLRYTSARVVQPGRRRQIQNLYSVGSNPSASKINFNCQLPIGVKIQRPRDNEEYQRTKGKEQRQTNYQVLIRACSPIGRGG